MIFVFLGFVLILIWILRLDCQKPKNFPAGPKWYPIIGSAIAVLIERKKTKMLITAIENISKSYKSHDLLGLKVGKDKVVVAIAPEVVKEVLLNENFDGRPKGIFYETRTFNQSLGITLADEDLWQEQRRFIIRHLKDFGFARRGMLDIIQNEVEQFLDDLKQKVYKNDGIVVLDMQNFGSTYILNTLWTLMCGQRYGIENRELKSLENLLQTLFENIDMMGAIFSHFPFLAYIAPKHSGYNNFKDVHKKIHKFFGKELNAHKKLFKIENQPLDLMEAYLQEILSPKKKPSFTEKQLLAVCLDMFLAGTETTTKSLSFVFLYLIRHNSIQEKCQDEIDKIIGRSRLPQPDDKINLPYCEATILEAFRKFMSFVINIPHRALCNTKLFGYDIPKNTMVLTSFRAMMTNEKIWGDDQHLFRPERMLQNGKVTVPENFHPFGLGKRRCLGELMGRTNLFMFTVTFLQNYKILLPPGHSIPSEDPIDGPTPSVRPYRALIMPR